MRAPAQGQAQAPAQGQAQGQKTLTRRTQTMQRDHPQRDHPQRTSSRIRQLVIETKYYLCVESEIGNAENAE